MENNKINSVDEYIAVILDKTAKLEKEDEFKIFWFRGESNVNWKTPLVPNSYRILADTFNIDDFFISENIKELERNINAEFYRKALPYISSKRIVNNAWNRYFLMQHYKIYTRLLDWTENAFLALFFAIYESSTIKEDARVWILQPLNLNDFTINSIIKSDIPLKLIPSELSDFEVPKDIMTEDGKLRLNELTRRYLRMDFQHNSGLEDEYYYPLAIYPPFLDTRMSSQKACFTIFGNRINGLLSSEKNDDFIDSITISGGKSKTEMLKQLRLLGIDFESIFPDLDGLGSSISNKYRNKFIDNREILFHLLKKHI